MRAVLVVLAFVVAGCDGIRESELSATSAPKQQARELVVEKGVLRWREDGEEVSLFGVNYYAPFWCDYANLKARALDPRSAIDQDVRHLRRLGVDFVRIHAFDTQFSDDQGGIVETIHLDLLDYLVARLSKEGLFAVLTPIAWWNAKGEGAYGFSSRWKMQEMTSNPEALRVQCRFLREFASRRNRHSGRRYADDPSILAFELINEPLYKDGLPDTAVTAYVNALADALRSSGTVKPVFYNSWHGRDAAVAAARIDGLTGSSYPTGLSSGAKMEGNLLGMIGGSSLASARTVTDKAKMIYEYNAADTMTACLHPALVWRFRSEGVQLAAQFQYDVCALADENLSWPTHYLNLVYTPKVAMSVAIAAEMMRRLPRGLRFENDGVVMKRTPFVVDGAHDCAVCVDEEVYLSAGDVDVPPPTPARLRRVWGCGSSPVVATSGNGCYFLERISRDAWRLQLYPNVLEVADPFTGKKGIKTAVLPDPVRLDIRLPEFEVDCAAWSGDGRLLLARVQGGTIALSPGDYLLTSGAAPDADVLAASAGLDWPAFSAPIPSLPFVPPRREPSAAEVRRSALSKATSPEEWNFLDVIAETSRRANGEAVNRRLSHDEAGRAVLRFGADSFADRSYVAFRFVTSGEEYAQRFADVGHDTNAVLCVRIRACEPGTHRIEMMFQTQDGVSRVATMPIATDWRDVEIPLSAFSVARWSEVKEGRQAPTVALIRKFGFTLGRWLRQKDATGPQSVEIASIRVKGRTIR